MFLYSEVSSLLDGSNHFTLHPLAYLSIPTPTQIHWEAFNYAANIAQILFNHISTSASSQVPIYTAE